MKFILLGLVLPWIGTKAELLEGMGFRQFHRDIQDERIAYYTRFENVEEPQRTMIGAVTKSGETRALVIRTKKTDADLSLDLEKEKACARKGRSFECVPEAKREPLCVNVCGGTVTIYKVGDKDGETIATDACRAASRGDGGSKIAGLPIMTACPCSSWKIVLGMTG